MNFALPEKLREHLQTHKWFSFVLILLLTETKLLLNSNLPQRNIKYCPVSFNDFEYNINNNINNFHFIYFQFQANFIISYYTYKFSKPSIFCNNSVMWNVHLHVHVSEERGVGVGRIFGENDIIIITKVLQKLMLICFTFIMWPIFKNMVAL